MTKLAQMDIFGDTQESVYYTVCSGARAPMIVVKALVVIYSFHQSNLL